MQQRCPNITIGHRPPHNHSKELSNISFINQRFWNWTSDIGLLTITQVKEFIKYQFHINNDSGMDLQTSAFFTITQVKEFIKYQFRSINDTRSSPGIGHASWIWENACNAYVTQSSSISQVNHNGIRQQRITSQYQQRVCQQYIQVQIPTTGMSILSQSRR